MKQDRLKGLAHLARMREDAAMANLTRASSVRAETLGKVAALKSELAGARQSVTDASSGQQAELFAAWTQKQLAEANVKLARQTADWMEEKQAAARAFGQRQVLDQLVRQKARAAASKAAKAGL